MTTQKLSDPNEGSLVLFKRFGSSPDKQDWSMGYVRRTYWALPSGEMCGPLDDGAEAWLLISPCKPEGVDAPTTISVPLLPFWIDPVVHITDLLSHPKDPE